MATARIERISSTSTGTEQRKVVDSPAAITSLTDSTGGSATNTLDDTTASVKDDLASLAAKVNEIIVALETVGIIQS